ncbi:MAG: 50S ribosomal protein L37ae [Candidatus Micrarchaeota archaeon]|nr:50S ribosomal protein L37ae [Candidatus Micrarchaeota archaeon]
MANPSIRYGASIRKRYNKIREEKRMRYLCDVCGKEAVRRKGSSIWECRHCGTIYAGGAYSMKTASGSVAKRLIEEIKK